MLPSWMAFTPSMLENSTQTNTQFQIVLGDDINPLKQEAHATWSPTRPADVSLRSCSKVRLRACPRDKIFPSGCLKASRFENSRDPPVSGIVHARQGLRCPFWFARYLRGSQHGRKSHGIRIVFECGVDSRAFDFEGVVARGSQSYRKTLEACFRHGRGGLSLHIHAHDQEMRAMMVVLKSLPLHSWHWQPFVCDSPMGARGCKALKGSIYNLGRDRAHPRRKTNARGPLNGV